MKTETIQIETQEVHGGWIQRTCDRRVWAAWKQMSFKSNATKSKWYEDAGSGSVTLSKIVDSRNVRIVQ